jgi:hypothetical protein
VTVSFEAHRHQTPATSLHPNRPGRIRRCVRVAGRSPLYCAALIPLAIGTLIAALSGQARAAVPWWHWLRTRLLGGPSSQAARRLGFFAVVSHALLSVLLGAAALLPLAIEINFILRGVFYGLMDHGPYNHSWGGPTRAGAWLAHFLISVPLAVAGLLALIGIAAVHQRLTLALDGGRRAPWLVLVALVMSLAGALFFVAWLHQLPR